MYYGIRHSFLWVQCWIIGGGRQSAPGAEGHLGCAVSPELSRRATREINAEPYHLPASAGDRCLGCFYPHFSESCPPVSKQPTTYRDRSQGGGQLWITHKFSIPGPAGKGPHYRFTGVVSTDISDPARTKVRALAAGLLSGRSGYSRPQGVPLGAW